MLINPILLEQICLMVMIAISIVALVISSISLHELTTNNSERFYTPSVTAPGTIQILQPQSVALADQLQFPTTLQTLNFDTSFISIPIVNMTAYEQLTYSPCDVYPNTRTASSITYTVDCPKIQGLFGWPVHYGNTVPGLESGNFAIFSVLDPADNIYKPAVLLYHQMGTIRNVSYYLARDIQGISWYPQVILYTLSADPSTIWLESLTMTTLSSGQPAVAFPDPTNMLDLIWLVASDGSFSSTAHTVTLTRVAPFTDSVYCKAFVIDETPLLVFVSLGTNTNIAIQYANTATGGSSSDWTETLSPNCAGVIDRGFNAITIDSQIACVFACTDTYYNLYFIQAPINTWNSGSNIIAVDTGSATFDIVRGALTINTVTYNNLTVPIIGTTYTNSGTQFFRFYVSSTAQGGSGAWTQHFELTTSPYVSPTHVSATSLPNGQLAVLFYNTTQAEMNTNISYTIIDANNTNNIAYAYFSKNSTIGTSMTLQYSDTTKQLYGIYLSTETIDSLGPTREIGAMWFSTTALNFPMQVNVQVDLVATGLVSI